MNPKIKEIIDDLQKANPGLSNEEAIEAVVDFASEHLEDIIANLTLPKKRRITQKAIDDLRLLRRRGSALQKAEISSNRKFIDDLNEVKERLRKEGSTDDSSTISKLVIGLKNSSIYKEATYVETDDFLTRMIKKREREEKSITGAKELIKDLLEDLPEK